MSDSDVLQLYPAFGYTRRLHQDAARFNVLLTCLAASLLLLCATRDHTLLMPLSDVGLFEHPGIWCFLLGQAWLPYQARRAVARFESIDKTLGSPLSPDYLRTSFAQQLASLRSWLTRDTKSSKVVYASLLTVGACAWAWNSYSNQRPDAVGFDFWDSSRHLWGYSATRIYKLYVWLGVMPALVHVQLGLVSSTRNLLLEASRDRNLLLQPFHADGTGGLNLFIDIALSPLIPTVFISSMISLSAVLVHQRYDTTTLGGLFLTCVTFVAMYLLPATALRKAIAQEKRRQIAEISTLQQELYERVRDRKIAASAMQAAIETMLSLSRLTERVRAVSEWPQVRNILRLILLAWGSPTVAWLAKDGVKRLASAIQQ